MKHAGAVAGRLAREILDDLTNVVYLDRGHGDDDGDRMRGRFTLGAAKGRSEEFFLVHMRETHQTSSTSNLIQPQHPSYCRRISSTKAHLGTAHSLCRHEGGGYRPETECDTSKQRARRVKRQLWWWKQSREKMPALAELGLCFSRSW